MVEDWEEKPLGAYETGTMVLEGTDRSGSGLLLRFDSFARAVVLVTDSLSEEMLLARVS